MPFVIIASLIAVSLFILLLIKVSKKKGTEGGAHDKTDSLFWRLFAPRNDVAGAMGEKSVKNSLASLLNEGEYLLPNLLLPLKNGHTTEVDCVIISKKGVFCVEIKNWIGHISGTDDDEFWKQTYDDPNMPERKHKNPVKQNDGHCATLERLLSNRYNVLGAVIFARMEDGKDIHSDYTYSVWDFVEWYESLEEYDVEQSELDEIYELLSKYIATPQQLEAHKENIRKIYRN